MTKNEKTPLKIFPGIGFLLILSVIIYFLLSNVPSMYNIAATFTKGEFVTESGTTSRHFYSKEHDGTKTDITERTIIISYLIYLFGGIILIRLAGYAVRTYKGNKKTFAGFNGNTPIEDYQSYLDKMQRESLHSRPVQVPENLEETVITELKAGRKLNAVKMYKDITGLGLKESVEKVEEIGRRNGIA
jgi:hypothetical protein